MHITLFPTSRPLTVHCMSSCAAHKLQGGMIHTVNKGEPMHKLTLHCYQYVHSPHHTRVCRWNCVSHCIGSAAVHTDCRESRTTYTHIELQCTRSLMRTVHDWVQLCYTMEDCYFLNAQTMACYWEVYNYSKTNEQSYITEFVQHSYRSAEANTSSWGGGGEPRLKHNCYNAD